MARKGTVSTTSGIARPDYKLISKEKKSFERDFRKAMYYIHYEIPDKKLKAEAIKHAKKHYPELKDLDVLENYHFSVLGKPCLILNQGGEVSEEWERYKTTELEKLNEQGRLLKIEKEKEKEEKEEPKKKQRQPTIQDRLRDQAAAVAATFDGWVDEFIENPRKFKPDDYDPYKEMRLAELKAQHVRHIINFYEPDVKELELVLKNTDPDLKEGYDVYGKAQIKKLLKLYEKIMAAANVVIESTKSQRPRKKKAVSADKKVAKLKYMETFPKLGLASQNPATIIGAKEVWVYNTKTRKLGKYVALDESGLDVKGTTILNFIEKDSVEKTLRKPETQLKEFKAAGKVALRKFLANINAVDVKLKGRMNENIIILKVVQK